MSSLLRNYPELRFKVKTLETGHYYNQTLVTDIFNNVVIYSTPIRALEFLQRVVNKRERSRYTLELCSECGFPFPKSDMRIVFGSDHVCGTCLNSYYHVVGMQRGPHGEQEQSWAHRHDYDPDRNGVPYIQGLSRYNEDVLRHHKKKRMPWQKETTRDADGNRLPIGLFKRKDMGYRALAYLGVELECEARSNCPGDSIVAKIYNVLPSFVICKSDGSLHNGLEIVTVPATFEFHKSGIWEKFFQENGGPAKYLRAWRTDTCGVHVHISKAALTPAQASKFIMFINSEANASFIQKFAGRPASRYAKFLKKRPGDIKNVRAEKYQAVNIHPTKPTLELRIFRGNISKDGVYRIIEFVQSLYEFCKDNTFNQMSVPVYLNWLMLPNNRSRFPYLLDWCVKHQYIKSFKKVKSDKLQRKDRNICV